MSSPTPQPGLLLVFCGPSGVGKSTLARRIADKLHIAYTVSATTRPHQPADDQGKTYHHVSHDEFFRLLDADEFLEYAQVYDDFYATPKQPALGNLAAGRDVLLEIDFQGAMQVRYHYPQALLIFILPPDELTLLARLRARGRETEVQIQRRYRSARREIAMARGSSAFDLFVVNDDIARAQAEIENFITSRRQSA